MEALVNLQRKCYLLNDCTKWEMAAGPWGETWKASHTKGNMFLHHRTSYPLIIHL